VKKGCDIQVSSGPPFNLLAREILRFSDASQTQNELPGTVIHRGDIQLKKCEKLNTVEVK
jgi:hypothetical protein